MRIIDQRRITDDHYILDIDDSVDDNDIASIKEYVHCATKDEDKHYGHEFEEDVEKRLPDIGKELRERKAQG